MTNVIWDVVHALERRLDVTYRFGNLVPTAIWKIQPLFRLSIIAKRYTGVEVDRLGASNVFWGPLYILEFIWIWSVVSLYVKHSRRKFDFVDTFSLVQQIARCIMQRTCLSIFLDKEFKQYEIWCDMATFTVH